MSVPRRRVTTDDTMTKWHRCPAEDDRVNTGGMEGVCDEGGTRHWVSVDLFEREADFVYTPRPTTTAVVAVLDDKSGRRLNNVSVLLNSAYFSTQSRLSTERLLPERSSDRNATDYVIGMTASPVLPRRPRAARDL